MTVKSDIKAARRDLKAFERKQLRFAVARALTSAAFDVRKRITVRTWPRAVSVRNRRFISAVLRVEKATKRKQQAVVLNPPGKRNRSYLQTLAVGGLKRPRKAGSIAVPASRNIKRTATGKIPKGKQPRNLRGNRKVIKKRLRKAHPALWQIMRGGRLRLLYSLVPRARVPKQFAFYKDAQSTASRSFPNRLRQSLAKAIATARF